MKILSIVQNGVRKDYPVEVIQKALDKIEMEKKDKAEEKK